jgi:hypothetical protein
MLNKICIFIIGSTGYIENPELLNYLKKYLHTNNISYDVYIDCTNLSFNIIKRGLHKKIRCNINKYEIIDSENYFIKNKPKCVEYEMNYLKQKYYEIFNDQIKYYDCESSDATQFSSICFHNKNPVYFKRITKLFNIVKKSCIKYDKYIILRPDLNFIKIQNEIPILENNLKDTLFTNKLLFSFSIPPPSNITQLRLDYFTIVDEIFIEDIIKQMTIIRCEEKSNLFYCKKHNLFTNKIEDACCDLFCQIHIKSPKRNENSIDIKIYKYIKNKYENNILSSFIKNNNCIIKTSYPYYFTKFFKLKQ